MRFEISDTERERVQEALAAPMRPREYVTMLRRTPQLIPEISALIARGAEQALAGSSALSSLIMASKVRRAVPDAAVGVGWYPPDGFLRALEPLLAPETAVLELGCGAGRFTRLVAPRVRRIVATDVSPTMVAEARRNVGDLPHVTCAVTDGRHLDEFGDGTFDLLFAAGVFGYVESTFVLSLLDAARRVLRPGGSLVFNLALIDDPEQADHLLEVARMAARKGRVSGTVERPYALEQVRGWCAVAGLELVSADHAPGETSGLRRRVVIARAPSEPG